MKVFVKISLSIALVSIGVGIGLLLLTAGRRPSLRYSNSLPVNDTVKDVRKLDVQVDFGEVIISQGDEFSIDAENLYDEDDLKSHVSDGVWTISHNYGESIGIFGFDIPISIGLDRFATPIIRITLPDGFKAENINVSLDAGRLKANNLYTDKGQFTVDAGSLEVDGLIVEDESSYYVGAGSIYLEKVDISNITVECDFGSVFMEGIVTGDNDIQCNVGKITLDLDDDMDLFSFDIDSDLGNVIINDRRYRNYKNTNDSEKYKGSFRLNVDVGNITMDFSEY